MSGTAPYYTEAFFPTPSRCFRPVSSGNEGGGPTHCPEPPTWRGAFRARNGRRYTVEACEGHWPPADQGGEPADHADPKTPARLQVQTMPVAGCSG
jgi:hypothetical protein